MPLETEIKRFLKCFYNELKCIDRDHFVIFAVRYFFYGLKLRRIFVLFFCDQMTEKSEIRSFRFFLDRGEVGALRACGPGMITILITTAITIEEAEINSSKPGAFV